MVQTLAGCGEGCGLPVPENRICVIPAFWASQSCQNLSECSFWPQDNCWAEVSAGFQLASVGSGLSFLGCQCNEIYHLINYSKSC